MGYDIDIIECENIEDITGFRDGYIKGTIIERLYLTYNHCHIFRKYNIYPRDFNKMTLKEIIPRLNEAIAKMKDNGSEVCEYLLHSTDGSGKYTNNLSYEVNEDVVLAVIMNMRNTIDTLPQNAVWMSD